MAGFLPVTDCYSFIKKMADHDWSSYWYQAYPYCCFIYSVWGFTKNATIRFGSLPVPGTNRSPKSRRRWWKSLTQEGADKWLEEVVNKLISDSIRKGVEKAWRSVYLLHDVFLRKVKMLKELRFELGKLQIVMVKIILGEATGDETGAKVEWANGYSHQSKNLFKIQTINDDK